MSLYNIRPLAWCFCRVDLCICFILPRLTYQLLAERRSGYSESADPATGRCSNENTIQVGEQIRQYFLEEEKDNIDLVMLRYGRNFSGTGQNLATGFVALKHWDDRSGEENTAQAIRERAMKHFRSNRDAQVNISMPASVNGLGQTDGLDFWIRDINGNGREYLEEQFQNMQAGAAQYRALKIWISALIRKKPN